MNNRGIRIGAMYSVIAVVVNYILIVIYNKLSLCWFSNNESVSAMCSDSFFEILFSNLFLLWIDFLLRSILIYLITDAIFHYLAIKLNSQRIWVISIYVGLCILILAALFSAATLKLTIGFLPYNEFNDPVNLFLIFQQKSINTIILFFIPNVTYFIASPFLFKNILSKITLEFDNNALTK